MNASIDVFIDGAQKKEGGQLAALFVIPFGSYAVPVDLAVAAN